MMLKSITRDDLGTCDCHVPTRIRELACAPIGGRPQNKAERLPLPCSMPRHWPLLDFSCPRPPTQWDQSLTSPQPPSAVGSAWPPHLTPPSSFFVPMDHILCANILVTVRSASKPVLILVNTAEFMIPITLPTTKKKKKTFVCFLRMFICKHMYSLY